MRSVCLFVVLAACSGTTGDTNVVDDPADTDTDTDTDADTDSDTEDVSATLLGIVTNAGAPVLDADLRLCRGAECRFADSDATGAYDYPDVAVDHHAFETIPPPASGLITAFAPLWFATDESRSIDVHLLPSGPARTLAASAAEHELGTGLFVTAGLNDLEPPLFADPATQMWGAQVPQADWLPVDLALDVVAMWYTAPFDYHAPNGLPIRIANDPSWALTDGNTYDVYVGSYLEADWLPAGSLTLDAAAGWLTGNASMPIVSTVLLVRP